MNVADSTPGFPEQTIPASPVQEEALRSPHTGQPLVADTPHSLTDGTHRYPVVDGIPFLRTGRETLQSAVLDHLDAHRKPEALALLLADRDDWARGAGPKPEDLQTLIATEAHCTLREAMRLLAYGPVADYFAYRWSDPTFLSGLALLQAGLPAKATHVVEIACGIGHFLRELTSLGYAATGIDVVFSKLWLARRYVAPTAQLICADVATGIPLANDSADGVFCHDAFYFIPEKPLVAQEALRVATGPVLIGHTHNREAENFSSGEPLSGAEYAALFPHPVVYDDAELTAAYLANRTPEPASPDAVRTCAALAFIGRKSEAATGFPEARVDSVAWQINPLLYAANGQLKSSPRWPSERYEAEYAPLSGYLNLSETDLQTLRTVRPDTDFSTFPESQVADWIRRRVILQLPARW